MSSESSLDSDYAETQKTRRLRKRARRAKSEPIIEEEEEERPAEFPLQPLLSALRRNYSNEDDCFDQLVEPLLNDFKHARLAQERVNEEMDDDGRVLRPLRRAEATARIRDLEAIVRDGEVLSTPQIILLRKLKVQRQRNAAGIDPPSIVAANESVTPLPPVPAGLPPPNPEVLNALYAIKTTPFSSSLLSRIHGTREHLPHNVLAVDWDTRTPWMDLMQDIHDHYSFAHPEREPPVRRAAPITYSTLQASQVSQINDLLERSFWEGIDISDSLEYTPERSTVVAQYKKIVVGVAIIPSPIETYITYLAVKSGWDKAQIARNMLFHLITLNPTRDFTLHVSTNNSAMLLYNQFGFKAEEFVAGFYADYLHPNSRASENAFKLRLRRI
ncbi:hypothetical protein D9619_006571 [Psilocybe cf. subviscida]|uniref:N-acetyltransferase domain-containing protein n=1 Tax=Psilocybe cf. subviscida TaxID=2480587 RepID=A0A8H5B4U2_9AGAR|nr:hypothetical protein D9619_006571 [Psilocybe cf. subviscida]